MRTETTVEIEGFADGGGSPDGEEEENEGENGSLNPGFRIDDRVRFSRGMDIELQEDEQKCQFSTKKLKSLIFLGFVLNKFIN